MSLIDILNQHQAAVAEIYKGRRDGSLSNDVCETRMKEAIDLAYEQIEKEAFYPFVSSIAIRGFLICIVAEAVVREEMK